jgi:hypothetical protein
MQKPLHLFFKEIQKDTYKCTPLAGPFINFLPTMLFCSSIFLNMGSGTVFTKLHFLCNLQMCLINYSLTLNSAVKACQGQIVKHSSLLICVVKKTVVFDPSNLFEPSLISQGMSKPIKILSM